MFNITLYKTASDPIEINKNLTDASSMQIEFKNSEDVKRPVLLLSANENILNYNYCYIEKLHRYYYIDNITIVRDNLYQLELSVDVLMSYKDQILNLDCVISRNEKKYNAYFHDNELSQYSYKAVQTKLFSNPDVFSANNYVLITV